MTASEDKCEDYPVSEQRPAGFKALVVEDETLVAWHLEALLFELGMKACEIVPTGREAIMGAKNGPDVIFMDVNLSGHMDGVEASRQILQEINVPIIFVTAYADDVLTTTRIRSALGERIILSKPATRADVHAALRRLRII